MIGSRRFLLGGLAALAVGSTAFAADVPVKGPAYKAPPPAWSWEGQYIGIHGGYAWATNDITFVVGPAEYSPASGFGGLQIGYNHHLSPNWVLGYEIDLSFGSLNETRLVGATVVPLEINLFGTARTRLGYVRGPWMLYATGGLAWATTKLDNVGGGNIQFERPHIGYAVGAGVEYAFAPNWSAKLEYLYADLGNTNTFVLGGSINTDLTIRTIRVGLNYRFAHWQAPVAPAYPVKSPVVTAGWTGSYLGVHGGYAWGSFDAVAGAVAQSLEPKGGFGGFQTGYNWQLSRNWVVGLESDSSWGSINQTVGATNIDIDAMGTVRARVGYAMNNWLFYGTGGFAWAHADSRTTGPTIRDQFYLGWAAGAGIEYAFAPRWSAKLEYIYADYGTISDFSIFPFTAKLDVSTIKLGINYRASILELIGFGR